jgi:hypothetical protein
MQESIVNKISLVRGQKMAAVVSMEKGSIKKEENTCPITAAFFLFEFFSAIPMLPPPARRPSFYVYIWSWA